MTRPTNNDDTGQAEPAHGRGAAAGRDERVVLGIVPCRRISWRLPTD